MAVGLKISEVSWVYILTIFIVVYATSQLNLPRTLLLNAIFVAALVEVITIPLFGWLSDHIGRRIFYFLGTLFTACFAFPLFWLLSTKDPQIIILTVVVALSFGHGTMFGQQSAYFPELFGTRVRYSGASFGFQLSAALGGGFSLIIATSLAGYMGSTAGVSMMLILLASITFIATLFATETKSRLCSTRVLRASSLRSPLRRHFSSLHSEAVAFDHGFKLLLQRRRRRHHRQTMFVRRNETHEFHHALDGNGTGIKDGCFH